jgi:hypothetical protein
MNSHYRRYRDWNEILVRAIAVVRDDPTIDSWPKLAEAVNVPRSSLQQAFRREFGIKAVSELAYAEVSQFFKDEEAGEEIPPRPDKMKVSDKEDGPNKRILTSESDRIVTLDQLLDYCKVDPKVWFVEHHIINKWEVGAKSKQIDLIWDDDGVPHGSVYSDGQLIIEPLIQIKAWLKRKVPIPIIPVIQPVACDLAFERPPFPQREGVCRALLLADAQIGYRRDLRSGILTPFHDRRAMDLALQIMAVCEPDRVDILGDLLDFPMWTDKFVRDPEFKFTTQPALCEAHWWLSQMRMLGLDIPIKLHQGNHELRMDTMTLTHLEEAYQLRAVDELHLPPALSAQKLLALHQLGVEWIDDYPDDEDWLNDRVYLIHGAKARTTGNTAKAAVSDTDCVEFSGHVHRFEVVIRKVHTRFGEKVALVCCVPCLCRTDGDVPGSSKRQDWSKGVVIVDYERNGSGYSFTYIPFEGDEAWWNGTHFVGRDCIEEVAAAFPDWNWGL